MRLCVYGASSDEIDEMYINAAFKLGCELARRGYSMVFGGGAQGLMGAAARGMTECGGEIIGVSPRFFNVDGILYQHCNEMVLTENMRERKQEMENRADGFIVLPGGIGTFEEFFEILTLKQLGRHKKPIAIYNISDYYSEISRMIDKAIEQKFMKRRCSELFGVFSDVDSLLGYFESYDIEKVDVSGMKNI